MFKLIMEVKKLNNFLKNKGWYFFAVTLAFFLLLFTLQTNKAEAKSIETKAESAIIVDVNTGKILFAKNENEALPPASMTKIDRKSTRLNSSHVAISYAVFCLKKKKKK